MSQQEINKAKEEAAKEGVFLTDEFVLWADHDLMYLEMYIEEKLLLNDNQPNN